MFSCESPSTDVNDNVQSETEIVKQSSIIDIKEVIKEEMSNEIKDIYPSLLNQVWLQYYYNITQNYVFK